MSYVDEVYERVVRENPSQPEFHQAVQPRQITGRCPEKTEKNEQKGTRYFGQIYMLHGFTTSKCW